MHGTALLCAAPYLVDDADEVVEAGLRLGGVAEGHAVLEESHTSSTMGSQSRG
jgi:hypothetical protein